MWATSGPSASWPENKTVFALLSVTWANVKASAATTKPASGMTTRIFFGTSRAGPESELADRVRDDRGGDAQQDRPSDLTDRRGPERREVERRERVGRRIESRPVGHADEDEGPDSGRDQPGDQYEGQRGATQPGGLDDEDCGDDRRTEDRRDRGEGPRSTEYEKQRRGRVTLGQLDDVHGDTATDGDERRLGTENEPESE